MVQYYYGTSYDGQTTASWSSTQDAASQQPTAAPTTSSPPLGTAPPPSNGSGSENPPPPNNAGGNPNPSNPPPGHGDGGDGGDGGGGGLLSGGLANLLNGVIKDVHNTLETASHDTGLANTVHGVTHLGETIGLGDIGGSNLLTDVLEAPSDILSGHTDTLVGDLVRDVGKILDATSHLVNAATGDLSLQGILNTTPHPNDNGGHGHLLDLNVGDLGTGLSLGELNVLDGGSIQVPLIDGLSTDALSGFLSTGGVTQLLPVGDLGGPLPDIGAITHLLPDVLDHGNGHFLL